MTGLRNRRRPGSFPILSCATSSAPGRQDLYIITIDGDSMEPLLSSSDRILIDTSQRAPVPPGIFVIWDGMGIVAKRVDHVPHSEPPKIVIKSINPEYQTYERHAEDVNIIGRVIWAAKRL